MMVCSALSGDITTVLQTSMIELLLGDAADCGGDGISAYRMLLKGDDCFDSGAEVVVGSQSAGRPALGPLVWSKETMLSSFASS